MGRRYAARGGRRGHCPTKPGGDWGLGIGDQGLEVEDWSYFLPFTFHVIRITLLSFLNVLHDWMASLFDFSQIGGNEFAALVEVFHVCPCFFESK